MKFQGLLCVLMALYFAAPILAQSNQPDAAFENQYLVVVGSESAKIKTGHEQQRAKDVICVLESDSFSALRPGFRILVAGVFADEGAAKLQLKNIRKKRRDAYVTFTGYLVAGDVRGKAREELDLAAEKIRKEFDRETQAKLLTTKRATGRHWTGRHWELSVEYGSKGELNRIVTMLSQGRLVLDERYYYQNGKLRYYIEEHSWDMDNSKDAPGPPMRYSHFFDDQSRFKFEQKENPDTPQEKLQLVDFRRGTLEPWVKRRILIESMVSTPTISTEDSEKLDAWTHGRTARGRFEAGDTGGSTRPDATNPAERVIDALVPPTDRDLPAFTDIGFGVDAGDASPAIDAGLSVPDAGDAG